MTADELQAAIERAESKRRELQAVPSFAKHRAQIFSVLPRAAELYKQQISLGLSGDREAVVKARPLLRELLGGEIRLSPGEGGSLWAEYGIHVAALLLEGAGTSGRGAGFEPATYTSRTYSFPTQDVIDPPRDYHILSRLKAQLNAAKRR
jgi:hypothetical protein